MVVGGGGGRGAKAKVHSTFWVVGGVGWVVVVMVIGRRRQRCIVLLGGRCGGWVVCGGLGKVGGLCLYGFGRLG